MRIQWDIAACAAMGVGAVLGGDAVARFFFMLAAVTFAITIGMKLERR